MKWFNILRAAATFTDAEQREARRVILINERWLVNRLSARWTSDEDRPVASVDYLTRFTGFTGFAR